LEVKNRIIVCVGERLPRPSGERSQSRDEVIGDKVAIVEATVVQGLDAIVIVVVVRMWLRGPKGGVAVKG